VSRLALSLLGCVRAVLDRDVRALAFSNVDLRETDVDSIRAGAR
jgi:hypothetical protein